MVNFKNLVKYKDMYNIYNLITKIDSGYVLYYDHKEKLFIILNSAKNHQICLKTSVLSPNIIKSLQKSRVENFIKNVKNIDIENEKLEQKMIKGFKENLSLKMTETLNFTKRASKIFDSDIRKIIGG